MVDRVGSLKTGTGRGAKRFSIAIHRDVLGLRSSHLRGPTAASPARPSSPPATTTTTPPSTPGRAAAPQELPSVRRASTISRCACLTETCSPPQSRASAATTSHRVAHDHGGSVAVVLRDPDGVELSYDHPRAEWLDADGEIIVKAEPFEPDELLPWARRRSRLAASGCAVNMNPSPVLLTRGRGSGRSPLVGPVCVALLGCFERDDLG